jgi:hypothetical protein
VVTVGLGAWLAACSLGSALALPGCVAEGDAEDGSEAEPDGPGLTLGSPPQAVRRRASERSAPTGRALVDIGLGTGS